VEDHEEVDLLVWMLDGYLELYGEDTEWTILGVEKQYEVWLPTRTGNRSSFKLKAKLDLLVSWKGRLWVVDHKSCKDLPSDKMLALDDQFGLYIWAVQKATGRRVHGSIHNAARTQRNVSKPQALETRFSRTPMYRTDQELDKIALDAYETARTAYAAGAGAERHPNTDTCRWRCDFTESCLHGRKTSDQQELDYMRSAGFVQDFTRH
jgi:hypothetical protein